MATAWKDGAAPTVTDPAQRPELIMIFDSALLGQAEAVLARCGPLIAARGGVWMVKWLNHAAALSSQCTRPSLSLLAVKPGNGFLAPKQAVLKFEFPMAKGTLKHPVRPLGAPWEAPTALG